jgi:hypothetical protein
VTIFVAVVTYTARSTSDKALNEAVYDAAPLIPRPLDAPLLPAALPPFEKVPSKKLGLGMLVKVLPGQAVPINGFLVRARVLLRVRTSIEWGRQAAQK